MSGIGARRGFKREIIFADLINNSEVFRMALSNALIRLSLINGEVLSATVVKGICKSDVQLEIKDLNENYELGCSIKAAEANFNQLDRRWLSDWERILNMQQNIKFFFSLL